MSNGNDQHRPCDFPRRGEEKLREQIVQTQVRRWELDVAVEEVLREIVSQCSVRAEPGGKFNLQFPAAITLDQQMKIARPLRLVARNRREHVIRQLQRLEIGGERMAEMARRSLSNPLVALVGKSPFDGYLTVCRDSQMHWGIVRALQHLRDAITVTREPFFTDPTRYHIAWRLRAECITPAMLHRVERCLRDVDARALHEPACNRWLKGLQGFFDEVKEGTFRLPAGPAAAQPASAKGEAEIAVPPSVPSPQPVEGTDGAPQQSRGLRNALRALRECLLPQYLDLAPEDFAALCRWDQGVADFAQQLGSAVERFSVRCLSEMRPKFLERCAARACGSEASLATAAEETGKCVRLLAEEAASLRSWLERELPQEGNSVGRRLLTLTESSLVSGLFFLFLQQRFAELFRGGDADGDGARRGADAKALAARRTAIIHAVEASLGQQRSDLPDAVEKGEAHA